MLLYIPLKRFLNLIALIHVYLTRYNIFLDIMLQSSHEDSSLKDVSPGESGIHDNFFLQNGM
jgi:hypothetical protein